MAIGLERGRDQRKSRRQRKATPGKEEKHSNDDSSPMWKPEHERITDYRNDVENQKRAAVSPAIDHHAAGIGVDRAEQCSNRIIKADYENRGAEFLEILWNESHPKFFASADDENNEQQDDEIAF